MTSYNFESNDGMSSLNLSGQYPNTPVASAIPVPSNPSKFKNISSTERIEITENQVEVLTKQGFSDGLAKSLGPNCEKFPLRFWIVDNSGSMNSPDGHRIVETMKHNDIKVVDCTRWEEIKECVNFHAQLATLVRAPTVFRLLNDPGARVGSQEFTVSVGNTNYNMTHNDCDMARSIMRKVQPSGFTPLREHVFFIRDQILAYADSLRASGQQAVVVIATDGTPTDEIGISSEFARHQFIEAMRMLEGLPVWIVIRLCTDDDEVVQFYNELDEQLELSLEVLDDYIGEAKEVYEFNSWLNYALPIHRLREFGFHERVFDLIDERQLTKGELREFCYILFGETNFDSVPDPSIDWLEFLAAIERLLKQESGQWNPITRKIAPWINTRELNRIYGSSTCGAGGCIIL